jgi:site-specific DNA recombinase
MSTDKQEDSPETQLKVMQDFCKLNGHEIMTPPYMDLAKSGGSMEGRAALRELIRDAEKRVFEGVIIYKLDRAFRNLGEQIVTLKRLKQFGIKLLAAADPLSEGAAGDLIANVLGAVNQFDREITGERIYDHNKGLAEKGRWTGGSRPPLGYSYSKIEKKISVVPEEAETIRQMVLFFKKYRGTSSTAWELNAMGLRTRNGLSWSPQLVYNVLTNPFINGKVRYGYRKIIQTENGKRYCKPGDKYEIFPGKHEALISDEDFKFIQDIINRGITYKNKSKRVYVFTGIFKCLMCGGPVTGSYYSHIHKKGYRCLHHTTRKDSCKGFVKLEYIIENAIYNELVKNIDFINQHKDEQIKTEEVKPGNNIDKQIKKLEQKLLRQQDMYENGIYDKDAFYSKRKETLGEIDTLKSEAGKREPKDDMHILATINDFVKRWNTRWETPMEYRNIIHTLIKEMYSDGKELEIYFHPFNIPGWREHVKTQL